MSESPIKSFAEGLLDIVREAVLVLDGELRVLTLNAPCADLLEVEKEASVGRTIYQCGEGRLDVPELRELLGTILPEQGALTNYSVRSGARDESRVFFVDARRLEQHGLTILALRSGEADSDDVEELRRRNRELEERLAELGRRVKELARREARIEQQERRRISEILHDDIQQRIYGIGMRVGLARKDAEAGRKEKLLEDLSNVENWLRESIEILRRLAVDLSPPPLNTENLTDTMQWLAGHVHQMHGLQVEVHSVDRVKVSEEMGILLFQIVRELLFNVVKHAKTRRAEVDLSLENDDVRIVVRDEGAGFEPARMGTTTETEIHFGLLNLQRRLSAFGGSMSIQSAPGKGTQVSVRVPRFA